ncbi:hypothetical protein [Enterococcus dispar]|uniref:hypothetical protein n=1 Tax=Enterococcus dispar TaxID=44009 RepID=UPI0021D3FA49|nr:hypothetical protein [Enterococcus dispar]MCU7356832.1 hypothetical protein [Enterococcus dispar]MDT2704933.1 hypothetical protein [Enterococcus dispar]
MNLFANDFVESFKDMLKSVLLKAVREILDEINDEEKFLMNRKEISEAIGCDPDTFDKNFRYKDGFPYHMKGNAECWNKKEVFEYLHKHKLIK